MKKFEEELNNGLVSIGQNIITKEYAYGKDALINYFKDWISPEDHQNTVASNKAYEKSNRTLSEENAKFVVENIVLQKQIAELKSQLEKQQPEIPEVPQFVAELIKKRKGNWSLFGAFRNISGNKYDNEKLYEWVFAHAGRQEIFAQAWTNGYTVKEKQFYLKNKLTGLNLVEEKTFSLTGKHIGERLREFEMQYIPTDEQEARLYKNTFTQQEIDSMETGSYEQIEVQE